MSALCRDCTGGVLGGVARYTNDVVLLCMSAGFDVVFIETVRTNGRGGQARRPRIMAHERISSGWVSIRLRGRGLGA